MRFVRASILAIAALLSGAARGDVDFKVLVFSRTEGFRHADQIAAGLQMLVSLGREYHFTISATEDTGHFTADGLAPYAVVIFLNTTGDVLEPTEQLALQTYIARGGGFVGIHSASDTEYGWPFYGELIGAYFADHPPGIHQAAVHVVNPAHPSTSHLDATFTVTDEWYNFRTDPAADDAFTILLNLDETTYAGGTMGASHPIAWCREIGRGRAWYTAMGHNVALYSDPIFMQHALGGIVYAAGSAVPRAADLNDDGVVDAVDVSMLLDAWGKCAAGDAGSTCTGDFDANNEIAVADLLALLSQWG